MKEEKRSYMEYAQGGMEIFLNILLVPLLLFLAPFALVGYIVRKSEPWISGVQEVIRERLDKRE